MRKLIFPMLAKKFVSFYGTRRLIVVITRAHHWTLYRFHDLTPSQPVSLGSILILFPLYVYIPSQWENHLWVIFVLRQVMCLISDLRWEIIYKEAPICVSDVFVIVAGTVCIKSYRNEIYAHKNVRTKSE